MLLSVQGLIVYGECATTTTDVYMMCMFYNVGMVNLACLLYFTSILHGAKCQQITAKS